MKLKHILTLTGLELHYFVMSGEKFEVLVHHGGTLENDGLFKYCDGEMACLSCDLDRWSYFKVIGSLKEMGYVGIEDLFYYIYNVL